MIKRIANLIAQFFAPAFELLGHLPPQAVTRLVTPF